MFAIVSKREVAPNVHEVVVEAPKVARKARAGQFVIVMPHDESDRVPFTLSDWDAEAGTVTLIVLEAGRTSGQLIEMTRGDAIAHLAGPLGVPLEIEKVGTVALCAGCYGIGAILCIARAMKEAGNRVVAIVEARSHYLHYYRDKLEPWSDAVIQTTADGSEGEKGHAVDALKRRLEAGETFDLVVAVGCPFMMMLTARETEPHGIRTLAALNPIMLDGTGMCGACRVRVGDESKLACVDGPFFDAHAVDWDNVFARRSAYGMQEARSLARTAGHEHPFERAGGHAHAHHAH